MDSIIKGTTPTINVNIPGLADLQPVEIWFSFKSGDDVYTFAKSTSGEEITVVDETISKLLTQEQTLAFNVGILYMQVRILDNLELAYATPWLSFMVEDVIQGGAMTPGEADPTINVEATVTQLYEDVDKIKESLKSLSTSVSRVISGTSVNPTNALPFYSPSLVVKFQPYQSGSGTPSPSNVRPIVGKDHVTVSINDGSGEDPTVITQAFNDTIYGGEYDFISGKLKVTHGYLSPYAGETIPEPWLSSMDAYAHGRIPTAGATVVYQLDTPVYVDYPAKDVMITNNLTLSTTDGTIFLTYLASILDKIDELLEEFENLSEEVAEFGEDVEEIKSLTDSLSIVDGAINITYVKEI